MINPDVIFSITVFDENSKGLDMVICNYLVITILYFITIALPMIRVDFFYSRLTGITLFENKFLFGFFSIPA